MNKILIVLIVGLLMGCLPVGERNQIQVDGEATLTATPDLFDISVSIYSREDTRESALSEVATVYADMQEQLPMLEGLEKLEMTTSTVSVSPIFDFQCADETYDEEECPIIGYHGEISIMVQGSPAAKAGSMLSFLSEKGASEVEFDEFRVSNIVEIQKAAMKAAVEDARQKAELIAAATGATIVGPIKIQSSQGFEQHFFDDRDTIIVTGSRIARPKIELDIEPQPVNVRGSVVAAFELE